MIKHQVDPVYDFIVGKTTPAQKQAMINAHHNFRVKITHLHFDHVVAAVKNYIMYKFRWFPVLNKLLAQCVEERLEETRSWVVKE